MLAWHDITLIQVADLGNHSPLTALYNCFFVFCFNFHKPFLLITVFVFVSPDKGEGAGKEVLGLF